MILGDQEKPDLTTDVSSFYSDSPLYMATHEEQKGRRRQTQRLEVHKSRICIFFNFLPPDP